MELLSINQLIINHNIKVRRRQLSSTLLFSDCLLSNSKMYYAHPLIYHPASTTNLGLSQSPPVSVRQTKKRSSCNDILLTVLFSLYGALHLAVAVLALFLIQVKYWQPVHTELGKLMSFCFSFLAGRAGREL